MSDTKVYNKEDCYVCYCGKTITPDEDSHWLVNVYRDVWRCTDQKPKAGEG